jgi:hypothetical protein
MSHADRTRCGGLDLPDRWMAEIYYSDGSSNVVAFAEIEDLDTIVEAGPDWNTIDRIVITLNRPTLGDR